jgi:hypothetical protein
MPAPNYKWPTYDIASQEHLQALGVISLNFNLYESGLMGFLSRYMSHDLAEFLFDKLNNEMRQKLIRELITSKEPDHKVREHIEYLMSHFSTCAANRHTLLHARLRGTPSTEILQLEKNARNEPSTILTYDLKVCDLRRTADEMRAGYNFLSEILRFLIQRESEKGINRSFSFGWSDPKQSWLRLSEQIPANDKWRSAGSLSLRRRKNHAAAS